jgi:uncharacterized membrane protein YeaQ/YmgE (transglycosylase-associated protein family)
MALNYLSEMRGLQIIVSFLQIPRFTGNVRKRSIALRPGGSRLPAVPWYDAGDAIEVERRMSNIIWVIVVGFVAGIIARMLSPGPNNPSGFILTVVLGIAGAFIATMLGQLVGWYRLDQGAGIIGATVGALVVLFIWNRLVAKRVIRDPGAPADPSAPGPRRWL